MATNFPTSVDNFTNPTANDSLNLPSHSTQHAINVTDAFNATYEDYKIIVTGGVSSASLADLTLKLGATTTGYYSGYVRAVYSSGASSTTSDNNAASFARAGSATADSLQMSLDLKAPFLAKNTSFANSYVQQSTGGLSGFGAGYLANTTSYTDFTITPSSGTLTGGTIYVYGYKKA
jgi:hypothetical protein